MKGHKKKANTDIYFDNDLLDCLERSHENILESSYEDKVIDKEFLEFLKHEVKSWRGRFKKDQEKAVLESIILLLDNSDFVDLDSKKAIFLYLREISGLPTKKIVSNLSKFRKKYDIFKRKYMNGEL